MSYYLKLKRDDDSSPSGSSKSPQLKVPASKSNERDMVDSSSVPGTETPPLLKPKAKKTFTKGKNMPVAHVADKEQKKLETIPPPVLPITTQSVANADSTCSSPLKSKWAFCQDSPTTLTQVQYSQDEHQVQ